MTVAWFSPLPPSTSGIAAYSAELLPLLRGHGLKIDTFSEANAHDFVWMNRRTSYALTVFQLGNAACHDYMWSYLFHYPGVVVLHDVQLHQARALHLTKRWLPRRADYLAEFRANHPEAPPDLGELVAMGGMGGTLFQHWPLVRLVVESARVTLVHNARVADDLRREFPSSQVDAIEMGTRDPRESVDGPRSDARSPHEVRRAECETRGAEVRRRHGIPADAVLLAAFGGITPEKRISQILRALSATARRCPQLHLLLIGSPAAHYDAMDDARRWRVEERVHAAGFVADDALPEYLLAADVCACLRWPTNRETSASWLRCLAAGRATLITDLTHLVDVPTVDPRGWRTRQSSAEPQPPIAVSVDLLDEDHSLQLAFERLATDAALRDQLGIAARAWWEAHHQLAPMADAYMRLLDRARHLPVPHVHLPEHLRNDGSRRATALLADLGLSALEADVLPG